MHTVAVVFHTVNQL